MNQLIYLQINFVFFFTNFQAGIRISNQYFLGYYKSCIWIPCKWFASIFSEQMSSKPIHIASSIIDIFVSDKRQFIAKIHIKITNLCLTWLVSSVFIRVSTVHMWSPI